MEGKHLVTPVKFSRKNTDGQEAKEKQTRIFQLEYCVQYKVYVCWLGLKVTVVAKSKNGLVKSCINKRWTYKNMWNGKQKRTKCVLYLVILLHVWLCMYNIQIALWWWWLWVILLMWVTSTCSLKFMYLVDFFPFKVVQTDICTMCMAGQSACFCRSIAGG